MPPAADLTTIQLDPGLAFGTGTHPTSRLCLQWLADNEATLKGKVLIDYGCGSGLLALAAVKLGAHHAWAVDIDPQAVIASRADCFVRSAGARGAGVQRVLQPVV